MTRSATHKNKRFSFIENSFIGDAATQMADLALAARDYEAVGVLADTLIASSQPASALYYKGHSCIGRCDWRAARLCFELVLRFAPEPYKQRALLSLANLYRASGDYTRWIYICERLAQGDDPLTVIEARRALAIARSLDGDHRRALQRLEALHPLVMNSSSIMARARLEYLNSLAVELNAIGKIDHAFEISSAVNACPLAKHFHEFKETLNDIEKARACRQRLRTSISLSADAGRVLIFPTTRNKQVQRIEAVLYDESITARMLTAYADAGALALARP